MKFGDKLRELRKGQAMTQADLAHAVGLSQRTIVSYENRNSYPKSRDIYHRLADVFHVDVNYLRTEDEEFITDVAQKYGTNGAKQAEAILEQTAALFAGGALSEDDQLAFLHEIQGLYLESKEKAKRFTPKKFLTFD